MNAYQQKWISLLNNAGLKGWEIVADNEDVLLVLPQVTDLKVIRDNLPEIIGQLALDIEEPKQRLKFTVKNGYEQFEYVINPTHTDLEE